MSRVAANITSYADLLCEHCGYTLNGLPESINAAECGRPIEPSLGKDRTPPAWEVPGPGLLTFLSTTSALIFRTRKFFRKGTSRGPLYPAKMFALIHWAIAALILAVTAYLHLEFYIERLLLNSFQPV